MQHRANGEGEPCEVVNSVYHPQLFGRDTETVVVDQSDDKENREQVTGDIHKLEQAEDMRSDELLAIYKKFGKLDHREKSIYIAKLAINFE